MNNILKILENRVVQKDNMVSLSKNCNPRPLKRTMIHYDTNKFRKKKDHLVL